MFAAVACVTVVEKVLTQIVNALVFLQPTNKTHQGFLDCLVYSMVIPSYHSDRQEPQITTALNQAKEPRASAPSAIVPTS